MRLAYDARSVSSRRAEANTSARYRAAHLVVGLSAMVAGLLQCGPLIEGRNPELVMKEGMAIAATTESGKIEIVAGNGHIRIYKWDGCSKEVRLYARTSRWYGSLGIYNPGAGFTWWVGCDGLHRAVVEEAQQHFRTVVEAEEWLRSLKGLEYVYNNNGLVVGWRKVPERSQLDVDVWQILIDHQKPSILHGAQDSAIRLDEGKNAREDPSTKVGSPPS